MSTLSSEYNFSSIHLIFNKLLFFLRKNLSHFIPFFPFHLRVNISHKEVDSDLTHPINKVPRYLKSGFLNFVCRVRCEANTSKAI